MARKGDPKKGMVRVKILPKDPLVARNEKLWPVEIDIACPTPASGPTGPHSVVVDYNADLDVRFAPAILQANRSFRGLAGKSNEALLADFNFHQVNVWAIVERTLDLIEDQYVLGRAIPWDGAGAVDPDASRGLPGECVLRPKHGRATFFLL